MKKEFEKRALPDLLSGAKNASEWEKRRNDIKVMLQEEEYGFIPKEPDRVEFREELMLKNFAAGKADLKKITITSYIGNNVFEFPIYSTVPKKEGKHPAFLHINFRDSVPDRYMPSEEILDEGFAVFSFCYSDVTSDDGDFENGLAGVLFNNGKRTKNDPGKIALWAWAAMRAMDYIETVTEIDIMRVSVCGHSRLGKTALLASAFDERFYCGFSNDSGCSGAAIARGNSGERIDDICRRFPYWFCENYFQYRNKEENMPFDQHFLIALSAPGFVYIASASEDAWADPKSEQMSAFASSAAWELYGKKGLVCKETFAKTGRYYHEGCIGYHKRHGTHYLSRDDWRAYIAFSKNKFKENS